ncbi:uncharacterized protein LOC111133864 isoform X3 [Crassostrea virginica]
MIANMHTFLLFVSPFVTGTTIDTGCCEKTSTASCKRCCINYYMVNDTCKGCPIGSMGKDCSTGCPYPFFGPNCKNFCDCEENICHEVKGCLDRKISTPYDQSTQRGNITSVEAIGSSGCCENSIKGSCTKCCPNYHMVNDICEVCPNGTWSDNCSQPCPRLTFGSGCSQTCSCDENMCDAVTGCHDSTTNKSLSTRNLSYKSSQVTISSTAQEANIYVSTQKVAGKAEERFSIQTTIIAVSAAFGMSLFAILLLVILLYRKRGMDSVLNINTHELQIIRRQDESCVVSTHPTSSNVYINKGSVMGHCHKPGLNATWSHPDSVKSCTCLAKGNHKIDSKKGKSRYEKLLFDSGSNDSEESDE